MSLGLVALSTSLFLVGNWIFDAVPNPVAAARQNRQTLGEHLAVQVAALIEAGDERTLGKTLQQVLTRNKDIRSIALRQSDGTVVVERGDHARHWVLPETRRSTVDQLQVPLYDGQRLWGDVEISFAPAGARGLWGWINQPTSLMLALASVGGFLLFYAFLRRAMYLLDPASAVPERVRAAFDILTEGVLVLNREGQIVLANQAFRRLHPQADGNWLGRRLPDLAWLRLPLKHRNQADATPWERAIREQKVIANERMTIPQAKGPPTELLVGCSPIADARGRARGCLVTFDDVSEVVRTNEQLRQALVDLEGSRSQIKAQNEELKRLATRDPLTGCLNRRAFFEAAAGCFLAARAGDATLCCIMTDIDHFKRFNDLYGHSVGDQVIQSVAAALTANTRQSDLVCRYGGEEFCILLPSTALESAVACAERMRSVIESTAYAAVRTTQIDRITSSFGVAMFSAEVLAIEELIDRADNALYASKEQGRNQVTVWRPSEAEVPSSGCAKIGE